MTTFTTLTDADLAQDKPLTQAKARALRDNAVAIAEGDSSAPRVVSKAIDSQYFYATRTSNQSITGTAATKVQMNTEVYDPDTLYDNVTNFRFTPSRSGLYRVLVQVAVVNGGAAVIVPSALIFKNGSSFAGGVGQSTANGDTGSASAEAIVQMNGTTDYLEAFVSQSGSNGGYTVQGSFHAVGVCES